MKQAEWEAQKRMKEEAQAEVQRLREIIYEAINALRKAIE